MPWTAPRGRRGAWIDLGCWRWGPGTVANSSVSTPLLSDSHTAHFCVPTAQRTPASRRMATDGFWVSPHHYPGQNITATGTMHQHSPARASLVAPRAYPASPCLLHAFAKINTDVNHFCLCRSNTAYASEASCTDVTPSMPISGVR